MIVPAQPRTTRIAERLRGQRLLVTGVTGLLAKVLVEKLLRSVPEIGCIHLLVRRGSDGSTGAQRVESEVLGSPVFDRLRALLGPRFDNFCAEKIRVVNGDLTEERLGLSAENYTALAAQTDLIVNSAAVVRFDERLDLALALNTLGPKRLLAFARAGDNVPLMQVSTCYVSGQRSGDVPEELAEPANGQRIDVDAVIKEMQGVCDRILATTQHDPKARRNQLIAAGMDYAHRHGWNDTYTFTKWLGEQVINRQRDGVPVVILRPAIIEGSQDEPVPGWIDGLRMTDPIIIAYGRGKLPEYPSRPELPLDIIPVDLVANAIIAALPTRDATEGLSVYQIGSSARNVLSIGDFRRHLVEAFRRSPMLDKWGKQIQPSWPRMVTREEFFSKWEKRLNWANRGRRLLESVFGPNGSPSWRRKLSSVIAHIEQLLYYARIYSPYTHLNCRFLDDRLCALAESMHPEDRERFPFDAKVIHWADYLINRHIFGLRTFVLGGSDGGQRPIPIPSETKPDDDAIRKSRNEAETIFDAFKRIAGLCGNKPALQIRRNGRWARYTYEEALEATGTIAKRLAELGLKPHDRIVFCDENCPEWGLAYLGAMRAGLTVVPLDPQMPPEEAMACARFAEAKLICAGSTTFGTLSSACRQSKNGQDHPLPVVRMLAALVPPPGVSRDPVPEAVAVTGDQIASILFTSGTTVAPKAVPLTHTNFLTNVRGQLQVHPVGADESYLSVLPMYHAFEFTGGFLLPMVSGGTITYVEQLKGPNIVASMQASGTTAMMVVPRLLELFHDSIQRKVCESGRMARIAFSVLHRLSEWTGRRWGKVLFRKVHRQFGGRLRIFASGGSSLDPKLHAAFSRMGFVVCEGYGLTETSPVLTLNPPGGGKPGSAGQALPGVDLEIRNANSEGIGELWARGPTIMKEYMDNPEATAEVMRDGWFRTGDLCRRDADGYFYIMGRIKDLIVTNAGKNVYPDEVETRYRNLPHVKEMCVVGIPAPGGFGETVHAVVVPELDGVSDGSSSRMEQEIWQAAADISETIPSHQRIQTLHFWYDELPKTSTMKAKRGIIRSRLRADHEVHALANGGEAVRAGAYLNGSQMALTDGQSFILELLARMTHRPESVVHPESNLSLDLGVDSLLKLQVITELENQFGIRCSDEQAAAVARVSDLFALVGNRPLVRSKAAGVASWRKRLRQGKSESRRTAPTGLYERMPVPLMPARWAARGGLALFFRSYVRVQVEGLHHIPRKGRFILAANHASHLDAGAVITAINGRRRLWIAGAQDYFFNTQIKSWVFSRLFDTIPFDRQAEGLAGLRRCLEALKQGEGVLFFPEGTRSTSGRIQEFKIGVAVMAVEANAPVIPTHIENSYQLLRKGQRFVRPGVVRITFGEPVLPQRWNGGETIHDQYDRYRELSQFIRSRIEAKGHPEVVRSGALMESGR